MGGRCDLDTGLVGPRCTDNFQIVEDKFSFRGHEWWSVEQAYQAAKFVSGSSQFIAIQSMNPDHLLDDYDFGMKVWRVGQKFKITTPNWDDVKVKTMLLVNIAKFRASKQFQEDLAATGKVEIIAMPSTWKWQHWNSKIMTAIRSEIQRGQFDLMQKIVQPLSSSDAMDYLDCY